MFNLWQIDRKVKELPQITIKGKLTSDKAKEVLGDSNDVLVKDIYTGNKSVKIQAIGIDGLIDSDVIDNYVLRPFTNIALNKTEKDLYEMCKNGVIYHISQKEIKDINEAVENILQGNTVVFFDHLEKAVSFDAKNLPARSITEPENESVLKGAKDAFIESIRVNTGLVRKKLKTPMLRLESFTVGKEAVTKLNIVYIEGVTDEDLLNKVREKIKNIDMNDLISAGKFEICMKDYKYSLFPQLLFTERVEKFCANICDGKVGVLIDGLPIAYLLPGVFSTYFQAPEDYSQNYVLSSGIRLLRYICFIITLVLPALYIAITMFHHEMMPTDLAISIIESKEGVPFDTAVEIVIMLVAFELLLEASLRLPKTIGSTISIIGGLIVGEAAVNAKFISPAVVVIIAFTGITGFVIPNQEMSNALRVCRIFLVICASLAGMFGISFGLLFILYYLCSIEVLGVPYMVPFVANGGKNMLKDTIIRLPRDLFGGKDD
ncbi:MAG: spore germination protein [Clostridia bacterium]|nr:spore germination protein [Clostridia bacterium]